MEIPRASLFQRPPKGDSDKEADDLFCQATTFEKSLDNTSEIFVREPPVTPEMMRFKKNGMPYHPYRVKKSEKKHYFRQF